MADKIRVVFSTIFYPVAIGKYFEQALRRRDDVELLSVGPYTGTYIPWKRGMHIDEKYCQPPDIPLSQNLIGNVAVSPAIVERQLSWEPDLWINADAGFAFSKPACPYAVIATDPHVLQYGFQRIQASRFYNMQKVYSTGADSYLPYCADPVWHSPLDMEIEYDVCLIGLQYENRTRLVNRLRSKGLKVFYDTGQCYREYQELYAKSRIALSWSSKQDLIARVFEGMLMNVPTVCNRVPDMGLHFEDGTHYYGFDTIDEAEAQVHMALANYDDALQVAHNAHREVKAKHLYDHRVEQILQDFELI